MNLREEVLKINQRIVADNEHQLDIRALDFFSNLNETVIMDVENILNEEYYDSFSSQEKEAIKVNAIFNAFVDILACANLKIIEWHHQFMVEINEGVIESDTEFDISLKECVEMFGKLIINKLKDNAAEERAAVESLGLF